MKLLEKITCTAIKTWLFLIFLKILIWIQGIICCGWESPNKYSEQAYMLSSLYLNLFLFTAGLGGIISLLILIIFISRSIKLIKRKINF